MAGSGVAQLRDDDDIVLSVKNLVMEFKVGRDDRTVNSLKICILSAFIISPSSFFANLIAKLDFPEAVGPAKSTNFLDKINLF